jgi:putative flippase GtrA
MNLLSGKVFFVQKIKFRNYFESKKIFNIFFHCLTYSYKFVDHNHLMRDLLIRQKQVLFFIIAGGLSAIVEIGSFKLLSTSLPHLFPRETNFHGVHYPLSNIFSTSCGIITNYFLSIWFVFERGKHSKKKEFAYFMMVSFISTLLSLGFFQVFYSYVFKENIDLTVYTLSPEIISKIAAILLVSVLNYSIKKKIIFNG